MRTYQDAKTIAKSLRTSLASRGIALGHGECLEIVARQFGFAEWNILAAKLASESGSAHGGVDGISMIPAIPVLRVDSLVEAMPFYEGFLGFRGDWGDDGNTYAIVTRSGVTLHLDARSALTGPAGMLVRLEGLDALHAELRGQAGAFAPSEISFTPWDSRVFHVIDPFGNVIRFWENNPPGVARPLGQEADS